MSNKWAVLGLFLLLLSTTACGLAGAKPEPVQSGQPVQFEIETRGELKLVADETMISQADAIFLGRVDFVGNTIWHEQDGQEMPTHFIAVTVLRPIVDEVGLGQGGVLTINGRSPLDTSTPTTGAMLPADLPGHQLIEGDEAIFFVRQSKTAWGGADQTVLTLFSPTSSSIVSAEQLEELIANVAQRRPVWVQPQSEATSGVY